MSNGCTGEVSSEPSRSRAADSRRWASKGGWSSSMTTPFLFSALPRLLGLLSEQSYAQQLPQGGKLLLTRAYTAVYFLRGRQFFSKRHGLDAHVRMLEQSGSVSVTVSVRNECNLEK